jgi:hypothetical protein
LLSITRTQLDMLDQDCECRFRHRLGEVATREYGAMHGWQAPQDSAGLIARLLERAQQEYGFLGHRDRAALVLGSLAVGEQQLTQSPHFLVARNSPYMPQSEKADAIQAAVCDTRRNAASRWE